MYESKINVENVNRLEDALILDCVWLCHSKKVRIPETEDMAEYKRPSLKGIDRVCRRGRGGAGCGAGINKGYFGQGEAMKFYEFGNKNNPVILLLPGFLQRRLDKKTPKDRVL